MYQPGPLNMSDRFDEKTDLPDLDEFQNARFAGELADCPKDIEVLRTVEFQSLLFANVYTYIFM